MLDDSGQPYYYEVEVSAFLGDVVVVGERVCRQLLGEHVGRTDVGAVAGVGLGFVVRSLGFRCGKLLSKLFRLSLVRGSLGGTKYFLDVSFFWMDGRECIDIYELCLPYL